MTAAVNVLIFVYLKNITKQERYSETENKKLFTEMTGFG
tara:strand:- start:475 stop:591 length:117 start_codon:yes stop_codon:yes gene_type:complete